MPNKVQLDLSSTLAQLAAAGAEASPDLVQEFRTTLGRGLDAPSRLTLIAWLAELPQTINGRHLRALLASDLDLATAESDWRRYLDLQSDPDPSDMLLYLRILNGANRMADAERELRRLLERPLTYAFFVRAGKLIARIAGALPATALRTARIAILGEHTTGFLVPILRTLCVRDRIAAGFYEGLYGAQTQEVLGSGGALEEFRPDIVILPASWRELRGELQMQDRVQLWNRLAERFGCHVIQFAFDYPLVDSSGQARAIDALNRGLYEAAPNFVSILDQSQLQRRVGNAWEDPQHWANYQQHPAPAAIPELAESILGHVRAVLGLARKVVVTDLDNTLWGGVIGEDGMDGIKIGPGSPAGEAHLALQLYLKDLQSRGVLLAVSSKNNPEDARAPFEKHPGMALRLDDFAAFRANWDDKAQNIQAIAKDLSLGLDSFVFLDDSPIERAWVRSQLPEVSVAHLGPSVFTWPADLDRRRFFDQLSLSAEDLDRAARYREESARQSVGSSFESLDQFLEQLGLEASADPVSAANLARVTQLLNKTNQFNLTTRRYTEAQVQQMAADPEGWAQAFHLSDRFGSYGLIGVILCRAVDLAAWEIDTWLMSCRALGREMEKFQFDRLVEAAAARGIRKLIGVYRPSAKNSLVARLYEQMGFSRSPETAEIGQDEVRFQFDVPERPAATATHVRHVTQA